MDGKPLVIMFDPRKRRQGGLRRPPGGGPQGGAAGRGHCRLRRRRCEAVGYTHTTHYNIVPGYAAGSEEHTYAELVEAHQRAWRGSREQPYIRPHRRLGQASLGRDRGLGQKPGWYFPDRTPEQFATALESAVEWMDRHPDQTTAERIVLLYAWNEFGEGGYLAPTKGDPEGAYLKAVKHVVERK